METGMEKQTVINTGNRLYASYNNLCQSHVTWATFQSRLTQVVSNDHAPGTCAEAGPAGAFLPGALIKSQQEEHCEDSVPSGRPEHTSPLISSEHFIFDIIISSHWCLLFTRSTRFSCQLGFFSCYLRGVRHSILLYSSDLFGDVFEEGNLTWE